MVKPNVLTFNKYYVPGYRGGGPIRSLENLFDQLGDELSFSLITLDRDAGDKNPYIGVELNKWQSVGKARVLYVAKSLLSVRLVAKSIRDVSPDLIYLNSFFDPIFTQRVLWARLLRIIDAVPIIIAPRGEFSKGALTLKHRKKMVYLSFVIKMGLYRGVIWQASSDLERADILRTLTFLDRDEVRVAADLTTRSDTLPANIRARKAGEPLRVCFLSRIAPMKNLDFALRAMSGVRSSIVFTIFGPKQSSTYWAECERLIAALPPNIKVHDGGEVQPREVIERLSEQDLFFLPTRGENFGHVINEALSAGLPVLISDQTPWSEVTECGVGWSLRLDCEADFAHKIDEVAQWSPDELEARKRKARLYARDRSIMPQALQATKELFLDHIPHIRNEAIV